LKDFIHNKEQSVLHLNTCVEKQLGTSLIDILYVKRVTRLIKDLAAWDVEITS